MPTNYFIRELPGILLVLVYVLALPVVLAKSAFKSFYGSWVRRGFT
jgi:hypothetical protein